MNPVIRIAQPEDAPAALDFIQNLAREDDIDILLEPEEIQLSVADEERFLAGYLETDNSVFLIAELAGRVVGTLSLDGGRYRSLRHVVSLGISVARNYRNRGIGKALLTSAIAWAERTGFIKRIELLVSTRNLRAIGLYLRFGFRFEGVKVDAFRRLGASSDAYLMAKLLD